MTDSVEFIPASLTSVAALSDWFRTSVKPVLEEHASDRVAEFERQLAELNALGQTLGEPFDACFLGQSQIGKSTLINALVAEDRVLLPSGGVGPLTAQAIEVNYGAIPSLKVWYHKKRKILDLLFALERQLDSEVANVKESPITDLSEFDLTLEDQQDLVSLESAASPTEAIERIKTAALLIAGDQNQDRPLSYLCDALRFACAMPGKWHTEFRESDCRIMERLASVLQGNGGTSHRASGAMNDPVFMRESHAHAAGPLAPMVNRLTLGWPSPLLAKGIRLVDLPGLGISNDVHGSVTALGLKKRQKPSVLL